MLFHLFPDISYFPTELILSMLFLTAIFAFVALVFAISFHSYGTYTFALPGKSTALEEGSEYEDSKVRHSFSPLWNCL